MSSPFAHSLRQVKGKERGRSPDRGDEEESSGRGTRQRSHFRAEESDRSSDLTRGLSASEQEKCKSERCVCVCVCARFFPSPRSLKLLSPLFVLLLLSIFHDRRRFLAVIAEASRISAIFGELEKSTSFLRPERKRACILHGGRDASEKHGNVTWTRERERDETAEAHSARGRSRREMDARKKGEKKWGKKRENKREREGTYETRNDTARAMCTTARSAAIPFDVSVCVALEAGRGR